MYKPLHSSAVYAGFFISTPKYMHLFLEMLKLKNLVVAILKIFQNNGKSVTYIDSINEYGAMPNFRNKLKDSFAGPTQSFQRKMI